VTFSVPLNDIQRHVFRVDAGEEAEMNTAHATSTNAKTAQQDFSQTLDDEALQLEALHQGLQRHVTAWRDANEAAIMRLGAMMARIDAIVERIERSRT
jgi:hypothetical protein